MSLRMLLLALILCMLTACATDTSVPMNDFCIIAKPIHDHPKDTQKTKDQVLAHNARYACVCESFCPKKQIP